MISPTALRGSFTQDRIARLGGRIDELPTEIPVVATATCLDDGFVSTSTSRLSSWVLSQGWYSDIPAMSAYAAVSKAVDSWAYPGSAYTTSTVVVSDGSETYTVTRTNMRVSSYDAGYYTPLYGTSTRSCGVCSTTRPASIPPRSSPCPSRGRSARPGPRRRSSTSTARQAALRPARTRYASCCAPMAWPTRRRSTQR